MRIKRDIQAGFLALILMLVLAFPIGAHAQTTSATATSDPSIVSGGSITNVCADGSDLAASQAAAAAGAAARLKAAQDAGALFPPLNINTQCFKNIMNIYNTLPGLADPKKIAGTIMGLIMSQVSNLVNSVCTQVMGDITAVENAVKQMAQICLPMPSFGLNLGLNISAQGCTGGTAIPLLGPSGSVGPAYNWNAYSTNQPLTTQQ